MEGCVRRMCKKEELVSYSFLAHDANQPFVSFTIDATLEARVEEKNNPWREW